MMAGEWRVVAWGTAVREIRLSQSRSIYRMSLEEPKSMLPQMYTLFKY